LPKAREKGERGKEHYVGRGALPSLYRRRAGTNIVASFDPTKGGWDKFQLSKTFLFLIKIIYLKLNKLKKNCLPKVSSIPQ
jgi:hypothetical protein